MEDTFKMIYKIINTLRLYIQKEKTIFLSKEHSKYMDCSRSSTKNSCHLSRFYVLFVGGVFQTNRSRKATYLDHPQTKRLGFVSLSVAKPEGLRFFISLSVQPSLVTATSA